MKRLREEGKTGREIAEWIGCCVATVYRHLNGWTRPKRTKAASYYSRLYRQRIRLDPEKLEAYNKGCRERQKRYRDRLKYRNLKEAAE